MLKPLSICLPIIFSIMTPATWAAGDAEQKIIVMTTGPAIDDELEEVFAIGERYEYRDKRVCVPTNSDASSNPLYMIHVETGETVRIADSSRVIQGTTDSLEATISCAFDDGLVAFSGFYGGFTNGIMAVDIDADFEPTGDPALLISAGDTLPDGATFINTENAFVADDAVVFGNINDVYGFDRTSLSLVTYWNDDSVYPGTTNAANVAGFSVSRGTTLATTITDIQGRRGLAYTDLEINSAELVLSDPALSSNLGVVDIDATSTSTIWSQVELSGDILIREYDGDTTETLVQPGDPLVGGDTIARVRSVPRLSAYQGGVCVYYDAAVSTDPFGPSKLVRTCRMPPNEEPTSTVLLSVGDVIEGETVASWFALPPRAAWSRQVVANAMMASGIGALILVGDAPMDDDDDGDGVPNATDNCMQAPNADQVDADGDGYGNRCDADFNNDCIVNVSDLGLLRIGFFGDDAVLDLNSDGVVNAVDLGLLRVGFFAAPGPSLVGNCP